ncbi:MAG: cytochrome P450 [Acidobacteriota bacterium]
METQSKCVHHEPMAPVAAASPEVTTPDIAPAPRAVPMIGWRGNALSFFRNPIRYMSDLRATYGSVACLAEGLNPTLFFQPSGSRGRTFFAFGPEHNRQILTQLQDFQTRRPRGPRTRAFDRLSNNILFMNGAKHTEQRRLLMPAFTREHLQSYHRDIVRLTEKALEAWQPGDRRDMLPEMSRLTLKIGTKTLFGLAPTEDSRSLAIKIRHMIDAMFSPVTMLPVDLPGTPYRRLRRNMEDIATSLREEIERKRRNGADGSDFLSMMIAARDEDEGRLTDDELISQSFVMFFAGHDTTSCALAWTLFLLAMHPEAMEELLAELDEHLAGGPPDYQQIYTLPVLDRVVKESLRVLSPGVVFPRVAVRDTQLGKFEVPAGSEVLFSPYITHHDSAVYENPERFLPERWKTLKASPYEYLPFGAGARKCLGAGLGTMQLKVIVAMIVQRYRLRMVSGTRIDPHVNVVMSPKHGLPMVVHPQDREHAHSKARVEGYIHRMVDLS